MVQLMIRPQHEGELAHGKTPENYLRLLLYNHGGLALVITSRTIAGGWCVQACSCHAVSRAITLVAAFEEMGTSVCRAIRPELQYMSMVE